MKSLSEELFGIDLFGTSTPDTHYKSHAEVADVLISSHNLKVRMAERAAKQKEKDKEK